MNTEPIYIIDETTGQDDPSYNPMLDPSINMEDFISINERDLPGKKPSFNNVANAKTKEVQVMGLVLNFSADLSDSRLRSITGRNNIENLYLFADTIIVNNKLVFPQTDVTIVCRHLIFDEQGSVSTTPENHILPYADGNKGDSRKAGAPGENAGNITLLCHTIENRRTDGRPVLLLTGARGQNGERGEARAVEKKSGFPLSWDEIKRRIREHDPIEGKDDNWVWPDTQHTDKLYFIKINSANLIYAKSSDQHKVYTMGDENKTNEKSGGNAIASGTGGNGGKGGKVSYLEFNKAGNAVSWEITGGAPGLSERIEGGKRSGDDTYYHASIKVWHDDINYQWNGGRKKYPPSYIITRELPPTDGNPAKNPDGQQGDSGSAEKITAGKSTWMHSVLLETMLQFAKTAFRDGERNRAKWILSRYSEEIKKLSEAQKQDAQTAASVREIELYTKRLAQNLDYYGYPPGWIPRLSVLASLKVIKDSWRDMAQLIYFGDKLLRASETSKAKSDDLEATIRELRKGLTAAQTDITSAFAELPDVQNKLQALEAQIHDRRIELRNLQQKIISDIQIKDQEQKIFTGSLQIAAGICSFIPVGQPYVGQLGGSILNRAAEIDLDPEKPAKEAWSFGNDISGKVASFYDKNKDKLKADLTSELSKKIANSTKELNGFNDEIASTKSDLRDAQIALDQTFNEQEVALLRDKMKVIRGINEGKPVWSAAQDYADIIAYLDGVQQSINDGRDVTAEKKQELNKKLSDLKTKQKPLAEKLKKQKESKENREKSVETAGKVIKGFTEGLSSISAGFQTMMAEFDENSFEVKTKMEMIMASKYKVEFEGINKKIADINKQKLPLTERLLRLEQKIANGVQYINNNLVQWHVLNDQRVQEVQANLLPATRLYLKAMVQQSWDMLMRECYYLTKSYQYRFIEKINPLQHGVKELITDINNFLKQANKEAGDMTEAEFSALMEKVLKSQFKRLGEDLLIKLQGGGLGIENNESVMVISSDDEAGKRILDELHTYGQVRFRLKDISSAQSAADSWLYYRIIRITFLSIDVDTTDKKLSIPFGIRHSGDSLIRAANNKLYFFTSRSSQNDTGAPKNTLKAQEGKPGVTDLQVKWWNANYNRAVEEGKNPISNAKESALDKQLLYEFLNAFELKEAYDKTENPYKEHYPGGTSELTLGLYDDAAKRNYKIKELKFQLDYEVLPHAAAVAK